MRWGWSRFVLPGYLMACCAILPVHGWLNDSPLVETGGKRRIVLVLDGVPYETIVKMRGEGLFRRFRAPARMISTFPSLTNPAMIEILGMPDSPGYEDHYFDRTRNRLVGGLQDRIRGGKFIQGTFRQTFDYHASALKGSFAYLAAPVGAISVAQWDLASFRQAFRRSNAPFFVGYLGATDSLTHLGGEPAIKDFLSTLDQTLDELMDEAERHGGRLEIEIFSDHGNRYDEYRGVKLNAALEKAGFVVEKSLRHPRGVVLPRYGLVGASELFTAPENKVRVAEVSAATEGVDFAAYPVNGNVIEIVSRRGRARLSREGDHYGYEDLGGDPLGLNDVVGRLKARGAIDANGYADRDDWWKETRSHRYIDAPRRLFGGFHSHVANRADLLVSYEDGYLLGSPFMGFMARMVATHGNLLPGETEGFAMSTRQTFGEAVRGYELTQLLELNQRNRADLLINGVGHCEAGVLLAKSLAGVE